MRIPPDISVSNRPGTRLGPAAIEAHVAGILAAGAATLNLGGDHFTTSPTLKAYAAKYGPMGMVQFDAHRDVEQDDGGRNHPGAERHGFQGDGRGRSLASL